MKTRQMEYLCQTEDKRFLYVSSAPHDSENFWYDGHEHAESFRLFIGDGLRMKEIPVLDVRRDSRDGSTLITTSMQIFFWPSTFSQFDWPTWGDQQLSILDPDYYNIVETDNGHLTIVEH